MASTMREHSNMHVQAVNSTNSINEVALKTGVLVPAPGTFRTAFPLLHESRHKPYFKNIIFLSYCMAALCDEGIFVRSSVTI